MTASRESQARHALCCCLIVAARAVLRTPWLALVSAVVLVSLALPASAQILYWQSGAPPVYAIQALRNIAGASTPLTLPAGFTWASLPFVGPPGGQAVLSFKPPNGDSFSCNNPPPTVTAGGNFVSGFVLNCAAAAITVQVNFGAAITPTVGTVTLGSFSIPGDSPGLATLATYTPGNPFQLNCTNLVATCVITASVSSSSNGSITNQGFGGTLATVMAQSASEFTAVATAAPANGEVGPACIDLLSYESDGMAFQQPCLASEGSVAQVVDVGSVELVETHYLGLNGTSPFHWVGGATVTLSGTCAGLMLDNIGSVAASCGYQPLFGAAAYLIPASDVTAVACPATLSAAQGTPNAIPGTITPPLAIFTHVPYSDPSSTPLYGSAQGHFEVCVYSGGTGPVGASAAWNVAASFDCGPPALGSCTALGEPSGPDGLLAIGYNGVATSFDFTNGGFSQAAFLRVVNRMGDIAPSSAPNGACLSDGSIGAGGAGRFVTGGVPPGTGTGNYSAGYEVVPGLTGNNTGQLDQTQPCQPIAQILCKVTSDDGYNGYASLFANTDTDAMAGGPGLLSGTNVFYPVYKIFQLAGIPLFIDAYNAFNYGSMVCYAPLGVTITQVQMNLNGVPMVNME